MKDEIDWGCQNIRLGLNVLNTTRVSLSCNLLFSAPRCTPPMPPVTNTWIPAMCAAIIVPDTVVPPVRPCQIQQGINRGISPVGSSNQSGRESKLGFSEA